MLHEEPLIISGLFCFVTIFVTQWCREDSNLHQRFRRPPSYPLNDRSISELHCKGRKRFSHYEISASLADFEEPGGRIPPPVGLQARRWNSL